MMSIAPATMENNPRTRKSVETLLPAASAVARAVARSCPTVRPWAAGIDAIVVFSVALTLDARERRFAWSPALVTDRKLMDP
jgi:hypothetical protein